MRKIISTFVYINSLIVIAYSGFAQQKQTEKLFNFELDEIVVHSSYVFENDDERCEYEQLKNDLGKIYPLLTIVRAEYERINKELDHYNGRRKRQYMRWSKDYVKDNYMSHLSELNRRQGRLLILMLSRELGSSPYSLIKDYLNGFHAMFWQMASHMFQANLKVEYEAEENPMIEHIMKQLDSNSFQSDSFGL